MDGGKNMLEGVLPPTPGINPSVDILGSLYGVLVGGLGVGGRSKAGLQLGQKIFIIFTSSLSVFMCSAWMPSGTCSRAGA